MERGNDSDSLNEGNSGQEQWCSGSKGSSPLE